MNNCLDEDVRDALPEFVNGTIAGDARIRVEQHVAVCADCADELELLRAARSALRSAPAMDVNRIASAVQSAGAERMAERRAWRSPARLVAIAVAAGIVAIVVFSGDDQASRSAAVYGPAGSAIEIPAAVTRGAASPVSEGAEPGSGTVTPTSRAIGRVLDDRSLALGTDVGELEEEELVALLESVNSLDALPSEEPLSVEVEAIQAESQR